MKRAFEIETPGRTECPPMGYIFERLNDWTGGLDITELDLAAVKREARLDGMRAILIERLLCGNCEGFLQEKIAAAEGRPERSPRSEKEEGRSEARL
jgi:hypothetical protein